MDEIQEFLAGIVAVDDVKITVSEREVTLNYQGRGFVWDRKTGALIGESCVPVDIQL